MKKIFLSCILLAGVLAASAQDRNSRERAADAILRGGGSNSGNDGYGYPSNDRNDRYERDRNNHNDRECDNGKGRGNYGGGNGGSNDRYRLEQAARQLNSDYDYRIARVQGDRSLRARERQRQVTLLERERQERLRALYQNGSYARNDSYRSRGY
ncbi:MAG: hypothetical protein EOO16_17745 [Chitinophagaceae bacterium]|nr:MAG: hypothetical protein EOO16_17745 [Chitinophagaceae bacterium]